MKSGPRYVPRVRPTSGASDSNPIHTGTEVPDEGQVMVSVLGTRNVVTPTTIRINDGPLIKGITVSMSSGNCKSSLCSIGKYLGT